jgi:hypothetical protein
MPTIHERAAETLLETLAPVITSRHPYIAEITADTLGETYGPLVRQAREALERARPWCETDSTHGVVVAALNALRSAEAGREGTE